MFLLQTVLVCILLTVLHESAHALVGIKYLGLTPEFVAIGIPYTRKIGGKDRSTHLYTWKREGKIPIVISWLLIGGGVGFKNEEYYKQGKYRQKAEMLLAGPASNILAGLIAALLVFGLINGLAVSWGIFSTASALMTALITHSSLQLALDASMFFPATWFASRLIGGFWQPVCLWIFWNFMVGLFNLLPIPGLDGGHLLMQGIQEIWGARTSKVLRVIDDVFLIFWIVSTFLVVLGLFAF